MFMQEKRYYICVTPFFPSPSRWQGAYILDQVKAIQRNSDYEVIVFKTCALNDKQEDYVIDGVQVHCIRPLLTPSYILNGLTERLVGKMFLHTLRELHLDLNKIAFVHCHTLNHGAFGFGVKHINPKVKVIIQFHDLDPLTLRNGKWADKPWNRTYRAQKSISVVNRADMLVCISEPVKDVLLSFPQPRKGEVYASALAMYKSLSNLPRLNPKNIYVLNNGVDASLFHQDANSSKVDGIFRIGCIANFQELKDHRTLVQAFNLLVKKGYSDMRLSLLGSGETKAEVVGYINSEGIADFVEWPQEVSHDQLPAYYHSLDLFILPSVYEGFGCVYTEAAACGVPYMGCYNQGAEECIEPSDRDNWLITPGAVEELAEKIERYYKERNPQNLCKSFDLDFLISDFLKKIAHL